MSRIATGLLLFVVSPLFAIPRPEDKDEAKGVVVGTITKLTSTDFTSDDKSVITSHTITVRVNKVEKGGVKEGDELTLRWTSLKKESPPGVEMNVGAAHNNYPVKEKDRAKFWLQPDGKKWRLINFNAIEKIK